MHISITSLNYTYNPGTAMAKQALKDISLEIPGGQIVGIIGRTGSGKSTFVQHLNGLLKATGGDISYDGQSIYRKGYSLGKLRQRVGLVFQYPEYQLFEADILSDVKFGPKNMGLSDDEADKRARAALAAVGVDEIYWSKSPFDISGGQKRRVAIAGVLAMEPEVLILDEPTAGLDPAGRDAILGMIRSIRDTRGTTIILVSHSMEDMAEYADRLLVMEKGSIVYDGTPVEVFRNYRDLESKGLSAPQITYLMQKLKEAGADVPTDITTVEEAKEALLKCLGR